MQTNYADLEETSISNATNLVENFVVNDIQKQKSKLQNELSSKRIIAEDRREMAFIRETL
jgi:hypothetical protein